LVNLRRHFRNLIPATNEQRVVTLAVLSLACIGAGCAAIYWPSGLIAIGLLLWIDLQLGSLGK
jgi:hypothetical protein